MHCADCGDEILDYEPSVKRDGKDLCCRCAHDADDGEHGPDDMEDQ